MKKTKNNQKRSIFSLSLLVILSAILYGKMTDLGYVVPINYLWDAFCFNGCPEPQISHQRISSKQLLNDKKSISQILGNINIDQSKTSILIEKSQYKLTLYYENKPIKSYPVVFGNNPIDDKLKEGDNRTPEGQLKIRDLYPHENWSKFIWLDYPNQYSWRKHWQAKLKGKINWFESIGSEIGIHGTPSDSFIDNRSNWTLGCISLKNQDVDELYQVVKVGTIVEIIK